MCDPVELGSCHLNSLSWADDLVIMSTSKKGLQKCMDKLSEYCEKWNLHVNVKKTMIMVLSKGNSTCNDIHLNGEFLECVRHYKYLGIIISNNGNIKKMEEDRVQKAKKAMFSIKRAMGSGLNSCLKLSLSLFDKQIDPILLYGSGIWGVPSHNCNLKIYCSINEKKNVRDHISEYFECLGISDINVHSYRFYSKKDYIYIWTSTVLDNAGLCHTFCSFS
jgi:DNA-binding protein YbaB